jgi:hypothetical protein
MSLNNLLSNKKKIPEPPKPVILPDKTEEKEDEEIEIKVAPFTAFCSQHTQYDEKTNRILYYILHYRSPFAISCWTLSTRLNLPEEDISIICEKLTEESQIIKTFFNGHDAYERKL